MPTRSWQATLTTRDITMTDKAIGGAWGGRGDAKIHPPTGHHLHDGRGRLIELVTCACEITEVHQYTDSQGEEDANEYN